MRLVADEWMSLDGIVQGPSSPTEDPSGGFGHGGWHLPYFEPVSQAWVIDGLEAATAFLFGRRTYETFAAHWPTVGAAEQALARPLNSKPKYLASHTLTTPAGWAPTTLLDGDAVKAVSTLTDSGPGELHLIGSAALARRLIAADLVDELRLMIDPVLLGAGKGLFPTDGGLRGWELAECRPTATGALLTSYTRVPSAQDAAGLGEHGG